MPKGLENPLFRLIFEYNLILHMRKPKAKQQQVLPRIRGVVLGREVLRGQQVYSLCLALKTGQSRPFVKSGSPAEILDEYAQVLKRYPYLRTDLKLLAEVAQWAQNLSNTPQTKTT